MVQAVSHRYLTAEDQVRAWNIPCGICVGHIVAEISFSQGSSALPASVIPPQSPYSYIIWETSDSSVVGRSSETSSHTIDMNNQQDIKK
jgi:hypothetical protein